MNRYIECALAEATYYYRKLIPLKKKINMGQKSILVLRMDKIGDMILTIPFLRELRKNRPNHFITLICDPSVYNLVELCPYVDEILTCEKKRGNFKHKFITKLKDSTDFVKNKLPNRNYEYALIPAYDCPDTYPEAWISFFSRAKRRVAYSEKNDPSKHADYRGTYDIYFTDLVINRECKSETEGTLGVLRYLGMSITDDSLELWTNEKDRRTIQELFHEYHVDPDKIGIAVNLSTSANKKDWPVERYIKVCQSLSQEIPLNFVLIGAGKTAQEYAEQFCAQLPQAYNFVGKTTLRETVALMQCLKYYLGGDTGPMHMAAACNMGGVAVFCSPKHLEGFAWDHRGWFPCQSNIKVIQPEYALPGCESGCNKDYAHCIKQITVDEVYTELKKQITGEKR